MQSSKKNITSFYKKYLEPIIPRYAVFSLIFCFTINCIIYWGTQLLAKNAYHYDFTTVFDRAVPFVPAWVVIYLVCYVFWIANYILISRQGKVAWYRFATADILSRCICAVIFIVLPTTNIRPEVVGSGVFNELMRLVYQLDAPYNLFPSIHCLVSWLCYVGIRGNHKIPVYYRAFSCIFALLVCASTQFTKQHYLVDVVGGIFLAESCYFLSMHTQIYRNLMKIFEKLDVFIFGAEEDSVY
jgi:membrane-associated phospholipid phosphatase